MTLLAVFLLVVFSAGNLGAGAKTGKLRDALTVIRSGTLIERTKRDAAEE